MWAFWGRKSWGCFLAWGVAELVRYLDARTAVCIPTSIKRFAFN